MASHKDELAAKAAELGLEVHRQDGRTDLEPTAVDYQHALDVHSGALMPDEPAEEPAVSREYVVAGPFEVDGHAPGERFSATLEPERARFLIDTGHLELATDEAGKEG